MKCWDKHHPIIPHSAPPGFQAVPKPDMHVVYHFRDVYRYIRRVANTHGENGEWAESHQAARLAQAILVWARIHFGVILD